MNVSWLDTGVENEINTSSVAANDATVYVDDMKRKLLRSQVTVGWVSLRAGRDFDESIVT